MTILIISSRFWFQFFWIYTQEWECWTVWEYYFFHSRNLDTVVPREHNILHSHQPCTRVAISLHLLYSVFLIIGIWTGMRWYLIWFAFPWWLVILNIFLYICWPFIFFFREMSIQVLCQCFRMSCCYAIEL